MMGESKYYTPEIEEFHLGFEFEVNYTGEGWLKEIFCSGTGKNIDSIAKLVSFLGRTNFEDAYRVKYLDKEDIESLGFNYSKTDMDLWFNKDKYDLIYTPSNNWLCISYFSEYEEDVQLFYGIIKNKSELKTLLKQLGIL